MTRLIQPCETPWSRAACDWLDPASTAVTTRRRFDIPQPGHSHLFRCRATPHSDVRRRLGDEFREPAEAELSAGVTSPPVSGVRGLPLTPDDFLR
jgi:hypothetical protein